jgi:hypothetical protein
MKKAQEAQEAPKAAEKKHVVILNNEVMNTVSQLIGEIPSKFGIPLVEIFNKNTFEVGEEEVK